MLLQSSVGPSSNWLVRPRAAVRAMGWSLRVPLAPPHPLAPPAPSPPPLHHYAVDACPRQLIKNHARCVTEGLDERAAVRCCVGEGGVHGTHCGASVCSGSGERHFGSAPVTNIDGASATYEEAVAECKARNMNLCSLSDVSDCCGLGCEEFDSMRVWTRSTCYHATHPATDAEHWVADELSPVTQSTAFANVGSVTSSAAMKVGSVFHIASNRVAQMLSYIGTVATSLINASPDALNNLHENRLLVTLAFIGGAALLIILARGFLWCRTCMSQTKLFRNTPLPLSDLRTYEKLKDDPSHRSRTSTNRSSTSCANSERKLIVRNEHGLIKPDLTLDVDLLKPNSKQHALPSGMDVMRPGLSSNRRHDGTVVGLHAGTLHSMPRRQSLHHSHSLLSRNC